MYMTSLEAEGLGEAANRKLVCLETRMGKEEFVASWIAKVAMFVQNLVVLE